MVGCRAAPDATTTGAPPGVGPGAPEAGQPTASPALALHATRVTPTLEVATPLTGAILMPGVPTTVTGAAPILGAATRVTSAAPILGAATSPTSTNSMPAARLVAADPDRVVVQIGEVRHSPWEPALLAQMAPTFSLLASGYTIFAAQGGPSVDGWYQTVLPPEAVEHMLNRLLADADVLGLASRPAQPLRVRTRADGSAVGDGRWYAIYVHSTRGEGRLVVSASELRQPPPKWAAALGELGRLLTAVDTWRSSVAQPVEPEAIEEARAALGWWQPQVLPFTPDAVVISATMAPPYAPATATTLAWPLEQPLTELASVPFGRPPAEVLLRGEAAVLVWRRSREAEAGFWGPLWRDGTGEQRFLAGVRIAPREGNHLLLDYDYAVPPESVGALETAEPSVTSPTP